MSIGILVDVLYNIDMPKKKIVNLGGRPSIYSDEIVEKLASIFRIGGTIEQAVSYAQIDKVTYYNWLEKHPSFSTKMEQARTYADIVAKNIVVDSMIKDKDLNTAKWWLEKREFKQTTQNNTQVNIGSSPVLVEFLEEKKNEDKPEDNPNSN